MRYWPEISFRYTVNEVNQKEKEKVNFIPSRRDSGGEINYTRCARVLRRDLCPGEKASNMSTVQNFSTTSRICNTQEPSWAEDFIDLSEFCQPPTIPIKMGDLVDERVTPPISSTVCDHGFDYTLEVNDGLDNNIEDNLWCMNSPIGAMQEELCDPISDWLKATKESNGNNNNDNPSSRSSQTYHVNDTLLSSTLTTVPKLAEYAQKPVPFADNKISSSPPLQPDTTFFHSNPVFHESRNPTLTENLFSSKSENPLRLPSGSSMFSSKKLPDTTFSFQAQNAASQPRMERKPDISTLNRVTIDTDVASPCSVQSPSITQSNLNQEENAQLAVNIAARRNVRLKLKMDEQTTGCCIDTPQLLQPLVTKNSEFDLVSYVFDDNKPTSFDISNLQESVSNAIGTGNIAVTIKTEPKEEESSTESEGYSRSEGSSTKRKYERDDDEPFHYGGKRRRRSSNRSSTSNIEDITQLESEKYRELRNRNNEASRRSRANRKSREVEMRDHAGQLEAENRRLKVKAEEMEQLVKRLRNCLMQLVLKRR